MTSLVATVKGPAAKHTVLLKSSVAPVRKSDRIGAESRAEVAYYARALRSSDTKRIDPKKTPPPQHLHGDPRAMLAWLVANAK